MTYDVPMHFQPLYVFYNVINFFIKKVNLCDDE